MVVGKAYLTVSDLQKTQELILDVGGQWTIGREPGNAFVFDDHSMSRRHGVIQPMQAGTYYFIDLGSRNGSTINGRRVTGSAELHDGDSLVCGRTEMVFHCPAIENVQSESQLAAQTHILYTRRLITVLVVDIRDFTPLTRQLDESMLAQLIGTWFRESGLIVRRYGCSGDKYIGDAVMAVWTHPTESPKADEMRRVLQALADLQTLTSGLHQQFPLPAPLRIGAGINTGLSVMGNTGAQDNPEFSPLGDSVNAAFRLETATKGSGLDLALGKATFECFSGMGNPQQYFEKRVVQLKGYDHGVEAWLASFANLDAYLRTSA